MHSVEYCLGNALVAAVEDGFVIRENLRPPSLPASYDIDLLYVECRVCGKPVLWEKGKTSLLLHASGINTDLLDAECMLLADGCPHCRPDSSLFQLQVVRVAALSPQDILLLSGQRGNA